MTYYQYNFSVLSLLITLISYKTLVPIEDLTATTADNNSLQESDTTSIQEDQVSVNEIYVERM